MKVRGHLQMYHAYIHESHPPSDSPPEEVFDFTSERSGKITMLFQPVVQESEPGWEMLDSGEGAVSGLNLASALFSNTPLFRWEGKRQEVQEGEEEELLEGQLVEGQELGQRQRSQER